MVINFKYLCCFDNEREFCYFLIIRECEMLVKYWKYYVWQFYLYYLVKGEKIMKIIFIIGVVIGFGKGVVIGFVQVGYKVIVMVENWL